ncbi:MAG: hypothetical protein F4039_08590 [Gammaproteobacteria bacterium]|nr:hypothetical protein [Gammaproteobacteria bacterium]
MKPCCQNCHFLAKDYVAANGQMLSFSWDEEERKNFKIKKHYSAKCHKGVWDTGVDPTLKGKLQEVLLEGRKNDCFFIEYQPSMLFSAADERFRILNDHRQLKRSHLFTQIGLVIAAFGLFANIVIEILKSLGIM